MLPARVLVTLLIIAGIGTGTGALVFGILLSNSYREEPATITATGAAILAASLSGLVAHLGGGFRSLDDES